MVHNWEDWLNNAYCLWGSQCFRTLENFSNGPNEGKLVVTLPK